jgi:hypothetical protein
MKKIMGMMLGLSLLMGTVALFADDAPAPTKKVATKAKKTSKAKAKTKKTDTTSTEKKS